MPVSNPSAFPSVKTTDRIVSTNAGQRQLGNRVFMAGQAAGNDSDLNDFIVVGNLAASAGITDNFLDGSIVFGTQAVQALKNGGAAAGAVVVLGYRAARTMLETGFSVYIGDHVAENFVADPSFRADDNVVVGSQAASLPVGSIGNRTLVGSVIIGSRAARGKQAGTDAAISQCVVIGAFAALNCAGGTASNLQQAVVIGYQAGQNMSSTGQSVNNTLVGYACAINLDSGDANTYLGAAITVATVDGSGNVAIGAVAQAGAARNTVIGATAGNANANTVNSVLIGYGAGLAQANQDFSNVCLIEIQEFPFRGSLFYGTFVNGNVVIGNAAPGTDRAFPVGAGNALKLLNGTVGGTSPVGGGYFYVDAGELHWVGSGGTDTVLAPA